MFNRLFGKVKRNDRLGPRGEDWGAEYLKTQGFRVIDRNVRTRFGEIDLVAKKGGEYYIVEVKTRTNEKFGAPIESISTHKLKKLKKMAFFYLQKHDLHRAVLHLSLLGIDACRETPQFEFIKDIVE